jgi:hypothetical protein
MVEEAAIIVVRGELEALRRPWGSSDARWWWRRQSSFPAEPHLKPLWRLWASDHPPPWLSPHTMHISSKRIQNQSLMAKPSSVCTLSLYSWHQSFKGSLQTFLFVCHLKSPSFSLHLLTKNWEKTFKREKERWERKRDDRHGQGWQSILVLCVNWKALRCPQESRLNEVGPWTSVDPSQWNYSCRLFSCIARVHPTCDTSFVKKIKQNKISFSEESNHPKFDKIYTKKH